MIKLMFLGLYRHVAEASYSPRTGGEVVSYQRLHTELTPTVPGSAAAHAAGHAAREGGHLQVAPFFVSQPFGKAVDAGPRGLRSEQDSCTKWRDEEILSQLQQMDDTQATSNAAHNVRLHQLEDKLRLLDTPPQKGAQRLPEPEQQAGLAQIVPSMPRDPLLELEMQLAELEAGCKTNRTARTSFTHDSDLYRSSASQSDRLNTLATSKDMQRDLLLAETQRRLDAVKQKEEEQVRLHRLRAKGFSGLPPEALSEVKASTGRHTWIYVCISVNTFIH